METIQATARNHGMLLLNLSTVRRVETTMIQDLVDYLAREIQRKTGYQGNHREFEG